ncbi:MAG: hypothetical protein O2780_07070 [Proteobacteria bacterium]|jgi:hypothetical protein|nr:hypothetical protein [Pseudomonadota bacterium]MDA1299775.1 hypothetical protein [Pseudomonadota bacterium]
MKMRQELLTGIGQTMLLLMAICLPACTSTEVIMANSTPAIQAEEALPADQLVDVGLTPFDPGIPATEKELTDGFIIPDVRRAEAGYLAYHLKDTLELTGNWGAVRVTPNPNDTMDLHVTGKILLSDGERLEVRVWATDSTGAMWLDKQYEDTASKFSYEAIKEDPFQDLYNNIADDLLAARRRLADEELTMIGQVSALRFAQRLSPAAFSGYLTEQDGRVRVAQLPARNDPMLQRVDRIKEREYLFVDTMDDYYGRFYKDMRASYDEWRLATYEEAILLRELKSQANKQFWGGLGMTAAGIYAGAKSETWAESAASSGVVIGGIGMVRSGLNRRKDAEIHAQALQELGQSLGGEITPYVLDIEGKTIELSGTAENQFSQWQSILKEIYAEETGLPIEE